MDYLDVVHLLSEIEKQEVVKEEHSKNEKFPGDVVQGKENHEKKVNEEVFEPIEPKAEKFPEDVVRK